MLSSVRGQLMILSIVLDLCYLSWAVMSHPNDCDNTGILKLSCDPLKIKGKGSAWTQSLDLYYFPGYRRNPSKLFMDVHLHINLTERDVKIYQGDNCSVVYEQYNNDYRLFGLLRQFSLLRSKQLNPFDRTVIGIVTNEPYAVRIRVWEVNYFRAGAFLGAVVLYILSYSLVRNALFFYSSGCAVGLIASLLIVGFTAYRLAPKKWIIGFPLLFGGWSISFYGVYFLWRNFTNIMIHYQKFVAAYFATVVLVSFAVCYRYGPPTDVRSHNLAQWALQLIALIIIYFSCQIDEISIAVIVILIAWTCTKYWIIRSGSKILSIVLLLWRLFFPKTRRLLTLEEYEKQGVEETRKAMEQLRSYCRSPQADAWKITSAISNPKRFASFVEGTCDHIEDDEIRLYEAESYTQFSDDSGEDEFLLEARNSRRDISGSSGFGTGRDEPYPANSSFRSSWSNSRRGYQDLDVSEDDDNTGDEVDGGDHEEDDDEESDGVSYERVSRDQWELNAHLLPSEGDRRCIERESHDNSVSRTPRKGVQQRLDTGYNGLLRPIPSHLPKSHPDRLCTFYKLTAQQSAIYKFLNCRGMNKGSDYTGESEQTIKQSLPEDCFDEEEFGNDLRRLVEVNLIRESFLDGYWQTT